MTRKNEKDGCYLGRKKQNFNFPWAIICLYKHPKTQIINHTHSMLIRLININSVHTAFKMCDLGIPFTKATKNP